MLGAIKSMFENRREDIGELTTNLERSMEFNLSDPKFGNEIISLASKIKNIVVTSEVDANQKIRVLSLLNRIKVRALSYGTMDSYRVFTSIDSISKDLFRF